MLEVLITLAIITVYCLAAAAFSWVLLSIPRAIKKMRRRRAWSKSHKRRGVIVTRLSKNLAIPGIRRFY